MGPPRAPSPFYQLPAVALPQQETTQAPQSCVFILGKQGWGGSTCFCIWGSKSPEMLTGQEQVCTRPV